MNTLNFLKDKSSVPVIPTTNRQVGNDYRNDKWHRKSKQKTIFKIDYLRLSIPDVLRDWVKEIIQGIVGEEWKECNKIKNSSYRKAIRCGKITICFDDHYKRQRFSLTIPSRGLPIHFISVVPWLISQGATIRRIDLAFDDLGGITSMKKVKSSFQKKEIVSRFRKINIIWDYNTQRSTLKVGSRCSDTFIRGYEKLLSDVPEYQGSNKNHIFMRWEIELKNRGAQKFVEGCFFWKDKLGGAFPVSRNKETLKQILKFEAGKIFCGKFTFRKREGNKNITRENFKPWWKKFVLSV